LYDSPSKNDFLCAITPASAAEDRLRAARDEIRAALRDAIQNWVRFVKREEWWVGGHGAVPAALRPMFRMQGSFVYRTLNDPAQKPPQQLDLDDGMFLPVSFIAGNGAHRPSVLSRGLFRVVELALQPLCQKKKWILDVSKPSCVRVKVSADSHIDLALYSIPDNEFAQLSKSIFAKRAQESVQRQGNLIELDEELYGSIASEHIMLAHRKEGWKPSDPRKLEVWFAAAVERHGPLLRRISRYLKAWRDHQWADCKLSSIVLMVCAVETFDKFEKSIANSRDDVALEHVAAKLHLQLQLPIENPVVKGQLLDEGWSAEMRLEYVSRAQAFSQSLSTALHRTGVASAVIEEFQRALGLRVANDESLVQIEAEPPARQREISGAPAVLTSGLLRERTDPQDHRAPVQKAGDRRYA
jgi:hypothetical protein